ncbi:MAG: orotidine-5'-phosphate decarboxylase [Myxococcales bacterium]|nr:orotidine-5'-phosphate decarboxylase [Myxococcales bacterium]
MAEVGAGRVIVALDCPDTAQNLALVAALRGRATWFKVGLREYYASGDVLVRAVRDAGAKLFLDLKVHDIPETVRGAVASLAPLAPDLLTVHAQGGAAMVAAARDAAPASTRVVAVTVLTSLSDADLDAMGYRGTAAQIAATLGAAALAAGADGLVSSPHEVAALRERHPAAVLVTPGIRPRGAGVDDQQRVATAGWAIRNGASLLVVGRPIWRAPDPLAAFDAICGEEANA